VNFIVLHRDNANVRESAWKCVKVRENAWKCVQVRESAWGMKGKSVKMNESSNEIPSESSWDLPWKWVMDEVANVFNPTMTLTTLRAQERHHALSSSVDSIQLVKGGGVQRDCRMRP
jgi:hypothetical protein